MLLLVRTACLLLAHAASQAAAERDVSLSQRIHEFGLAEEVILSPYRPVDLKELVATADAVVEVTVGAGISFLDSERDHIQTDHRVEVRRVLKGSQGAARSGDALTVRRLGGALDVGPGRRFVSTDVDFPPFEAGAGYLLFLRRDSGERPFSVLHGPYGAIRLSDKAGRATTGPLYEQIARYISRPDR